MKKVRLFYWMCFSLSILIAGSCTEKPEEDLVSSNILITEPVQIGDIYIESMQISTLIDVLSKDYWTNLKSTDATQITWCEEYWPYPTKWGVHYFTYTSGKLVSDYQYLDVGGDFEGAEKFDYYSNGMLKKWARYNPSGNLTDYVIYSYSGTPSRLVCISWYNSKGKLMDYLNFNYIDGLLTTLMRYTSSGSLFTTDQFIYNENNQLIQIDRGIDTDFHQYYTYDSTGLIASKKTHYYYFYEYTYLWTRTDTAYYVNGYDFETFKKYQIYHLGSGTGNYDPSDPLDPLNLNFFFRYL